jgi:hypothetical protein
MIDHVLTSSTCTITKSSSHTPPAAYIYTSLQPQSPRPRTQPHFQTTEHLNSSSTGSGRSACGKIVMMNANVKKNTGESFKDKPVSIQLNPAVPPSTSPKTLALCSVYQIRKRVLLPGRYITNPAPHAAMRTMVKPKIVNHESKVSLRFLGVSPCAACRAASAVILVRAG